MASRSSESTQGLLLLAAAASAVLVANSTVAPAYAALSRIDIGSLDLLQWVNEGLMALFFLVVGIEIKREVLSGALMTASQRLLPGAAALGGMVVPALIFTAVNWADPAALRGWAIPCATDIAFALGVLALTGARVPGSLKAFLTTLAVLDDLGAVLIIAVFYSHGLGLGYLAAAAACMAALGMLNRFRVQWLLPYLLLGALLWLALLRSGLHATVAGVLLALALPLPRLERLDRILAPMVSWLVLPLFAFLNAGVSLSGLSSGALSSPVTFGIAAGLLCGKFAGVLGTVWLLVRTGHAALPAGTRWSQISGVSLLCGIGFTMSLFITVLSFNTQALQNAAKAGILAGSVLAGVGGWALLHAARRPVFSPAPRG